ncbi:LuxR C-terminal-related transcriptional regulator [Saccharibacillus kuerlensis]|uniref:HTH luxR-type domain-containing protein n=1 Tax=Saccharibacillus kuerlensis TaxID=459527 RepID=A0ABQ2KWB7_9BACL|nr:LuxR C-terminal-related transcriptional regulator [Saccharibacillus kuerlensis]GGN94826.1 hypothetical protein GCM10010969_09910 [Saccharibacillus kuerlensis]
MTAPIMATKLYIPALRPHAVLRRRLTERLNRGIYRKLTLIAAPAGYGKTTLVCEWLESCEREAAWLSLEEEDGDPIRFLTGLISSLQTLGEGLGQNLLAALQSPQPPPIESILTVLLNEIAAISVPFILVLDDYHAVNVKEINDVLFFLITHLPPRIHIVITTRESPDIPLAKFRVRDQLTELYAADLKFTSSEAELFLNESMALNLSAKQVSVLESRTEGWIAGLHLAAISIQGEEDTDRLIESFTGDHRFVLDYLMEEVLRQQPQAVRNFLLRTSILDRLCGPLCDAVVHDSSVCGHEVLIDLNAQNLFIVPLDNERKWYRYHHLFADLLRKRLLESTAKSEVAELHERASFWHEQNGGEIEAFRHASQSRDIERAAHLLEGGGMPLHLRGAGGAALKWLEGLPAQELNARPALWVMYGSSLLMSGRPTGVEDKLQAAESILAGTEQGERAAGLTGLIAATRATLASLALGGGAGGGSERLEVKLREAEAALQDGGIDDKTDGLVGRIALAGSTAPHGRQTAEQVILQCRRALLYLRPEQLPIRTAAAWMLGVACQLSGDSAAAREAFDEVVVNSTIMDQPLLAVVALIGLGQLDEAEDKVNAAGERYREALKLAGNLPLPAVREAQIGLERLEQRDRKNTLLSPREYEVLQLIAEGLSNREIGERLFLSLDTVKGHNRRIFEKLQVQRRTEAIARAKQLNVLSDTPKPHTSKPH